MYTEFKSAGLWKLFLKEMSFEARLAVFGYRYYSHRKGQKIPNSRAREGRAFGEFLV